MPVSVHTVKSSRNKEMGIRVSVMVWPEFTQVFLAFATLLFIASIECFIFTALTVKPGMLGQSFLETRCKVVKTLFNGNTSCLVDSFSNYGEMRVFPCLQIYVVPSDDFFVSIGGTDSKKGELGDQTSHSHLHGEAKFPKTNKSENEEVTDVLQDQMPLLLFQNEMNFLGSDYLYRRCSYLPTFCPDDITTLISDICREAAHRGSVNLTYSCFHDNSNGGRAILQKIISNERVLASIILPLAGFFVSVSCCFCFWSRNSKKLSRLYIYNSWSTS